jgi:hypothetical protein
MDKKHCPYCQKDSTGICDKHFSQTSMQQFEEDQKHPTSSAEQMVDRAIEKSGLGK